MPRELNPPRLGQTFERDLAFEPLDLTIGDAGH
jgi:hypothetical protein